MKKKPVLRFEFDDKIWVITEKNFSHLKSIEHFLKLLREGKTITVRVDNDMFDM
jgi:hypothetical protein